MPRPTLFGAICPARAVGAAIVSPWVNSEAMAVHLTEINKQVCHDAHAVLVCDGAGWHQTGAIDRAQKHHPASPAALLTQLNPIQNVWEHLRGNQLSRRLWRTYDDIVQACCDAWNWLIADTVRVASITTRKWASVSS